MKIASTKMLLVACLLIFSLTGLARIVAASDTTTALKEPLARPKIGLALGGGGALGFTHIGVLKWLEEHRIPVDYIAGTSMGGLVGGAYAMGMSPAEIEQFIKSQNWDRIFDTNPPFNAFNFRRKEDRLDYTLETGLRDQLFVSNGMAAYRVDLLLSRLTLPYSTIHNFDELPIPYRCIATDLVNSKKVVLREGALSEALQATISIPGAFTPVEFEGRVLVDGGLVDNVPVDVTRIMGAGINIAVNCIPDNFGMDMRRIDSVLLGALNTVLTDNSNRYLELADCVVHPQVEKLSYIDWKAIDQFIAAGYLAADQRADELLKYQVDVQTWQEYVKQRFEKKRVTIPVPAGIEIQGTDKVNQDLIRKKLLGFIGRPIDPDALDAALIEIIGLGFYESIRYKVILRNQIPILNINVKEKSYGPPFIGFNLETSFVDEQVNLNLRARMTSFGIPVAGSELRSEVSLGVNPALGFELYQPVTKSGWFLAPRISLDQTHQSLFVQENRINEFQVSNSSLGFDLGYSVSNFSELRMGYGIGYQNTQAIVGPPLPDMSGLVRKIGFQWSYRNIADETFYDGALFCDMKANWYLEAPNATDSFGTAEESIKWTVPGPEHNAIVMILAAGATLKGQAPFLQQFTLGGPFRLGALRQNELRGDNYCLGTIGLLKNLSQPLGLSHVYLATFLENGGVFADWADIDCTTSVSIGLLSPTTLGSFYLGTNLIEGKPVRVNCLFGRLF